MSDAADEPSGSSPLAPVLPCRITVALLGNPNTGKTTLFNALAGLRQRVGNYPGVTVETKKGQMTCAGQVIDLIDLPGTYSLAPRSPDEMLAVDVILGQQKKEPRPDVLLVILDASNLDRNLYLATQALELGVPVVVALNMMDIAARQQIQIDAGELGRRLGVPVVPIQANKGIGLDQLRQTVLSAVKNGSPPNRVAFPEAFERETQALQRSLDGRVDPFLVRRLLLDAGGYTEKRMAAQANDSPVTHGGGEPLALATCLQDARQRLAECQCAGPALEARTRYAWIRNLTAQCVRRPSLRPVTWTDRIDRLLTHKVWGSLVFLALMFLVFQAIFTGAQPLMKLIDNAKDALADYLQDLLPAGPLTSLLVNGIIEGVGAVVAFVPQIVILFGFLAILEDCGYMARAAFLMDKVMARCGLSGKSFIPMLSSVACAVPGIMATRVIENRRDRLATILVAPLMSCSARLPVYILLIGTFLKEGWPRWVPGLTMFAMYGIGLVVAPLIALLLKRTLLRGETPVFIMEMPLYKWPSLRTVLRRMGDSAWAFVRRAGTLILASMVLVWALLYFPARDFDTRIAALREQATEQEGQDPEGVEEQINALMGEWQRQSFLGQAGQALAPVVRPLGWDWKIGMAVLASFPAREVVVGTLGIIYNEGKTDSKEILQAQDVGSTSLAKKLRSETWPDNAGLHGQPVFTIPTVLSIMVFFALCCQCASTLAVIRRETRSWRWPAFTFIYMTVLAYLGALLVFQIGRLL
jgi:ferrous iron transport protein B